MFVYVFREVRTSGQGITLIFKIFYVRIDSKEKTFLWSELQVNIGIDKPLSVPEGIRCPVINVSAGKECGGEALHVLFFLLMVRGECTGQLIMSVFVIHQQIHAAGLAVGSTLRDTFGIPTSVSIRSTHIVDIIEIAVQ